jgi:uncharacterized protein
MNAPSQNRPLTDAEIDSLDERLSALDPDDSMAVEELDGFFAALACCPVPVPREEWLPLVLGESGRARQALAGQGDDAALLKLVERHRVSVSAMLFEGEGFSPVLAYDEDGRAWGNAWAIGFARAMAMRPDAWSDLDGDEEMVDALEPVMRLVADAQDGDDEDADEDDGPHRGAAPVASRAGAAREDRRGGNRHDVDEDDDDGPGLDGYEPVADDERESLIHDMLDGVQDVYDFFREARERALAPDPVRRDGPKVGRNDPCPCGSGRKYKLCHGAGSALH